MINFEKLNNNTYFIGEIGINHNGDIEIVKKLIDAAFACNWSCVKFQKRTPDICVPENQKNILRQTPWGEMTYINYKRKIEFEKEQYDYIDWYCKQKPIDWSASVWDIPSLNFIMNYDVPFIKIPSALLNDHQLLLETIATKKPIILSTGMSTIEEIDASVNLLIKAGANFSLMHTNSSYPTPIDELNLNVIKTLKERYQVNIGYSGHEIDLEPTVLAVALGSNIIERHITLSHDLWGTDQKASLEVHAMDLLYKRCKDVNRILGSEIKTVTASELPIKEKLRP